ncbi:hypothetical protein CBL_20682 [Carabus blaptoides fortunei]
MRKDERVSSNWRESIEILLDEFFPASEANEGMNVIEIANERVHEANRDVFEYEEVGIAVKRRAERKSAVVVRPKEAIMTSEQVKQVVLEKIKPKINDGIQVNALKTIRNGGITIETMLFNKVATEVIKNYELMNDMHTRNLSEVISMKELKERARIITRGGKKDSSVTNVIIELPAWKRLVEADATAVMDSDTDSKNVIRREESVESAAKQDTPNWSMTTTVYAAGTVKKRIPIMIMP